MTEVTIFHVGRLGSFADRVLQLRPGAYTAVGRRDGYRDILREFVVSAEGLADPLVPDLHRTHLMMRVIIALPEGERELKANELPVMLASSAGAHIRLPGPATAPPAASINILEEQALVQCYAGITGLQLNGEAISGARWLKAGDRLSIAGVEVSVESLDAEFLRRGVRYLAGAWQTRPPEIAAEDEQPAAAIPLRPSPGPAAGVRRRLGRLWLRVGRGGGAGRPGGLRAVRVHRRRRADRGEARASRGSGRKRSAPDRTWAAATSCGPANTACAPSCRAITRWTRKSRLRAWAARNSGLRCKSCRGGWWWRRLPAPAFR